MINRLIFIIFFIKFLFFVHIYVELYFFRMYKFFFLYYYEKFFNLGILWCMIRLTYHTGDSSLLEHIRIDQIVEPPVSKKTVNAIVNQERPYFNLNPNGTVNLKSKYFKLNPKGTVRLENQYFKLSPKGTVNLKSWLSYFNRLRKLQKWRVVAAGIVTGSTISGLSIYTIVLLFCR